MANNSIAFGKVTIATLTAADVARLNRENSLIIREGERGVIFKGTPLYSRVVLDDKGLPKTSNEGLPIRELSTIIAIVRKDGGMVTGKITLSWLSGSDLVEEATCPLLLCKDGQRKYAATYLLTHKEVRDFNLGLEPGQNVLSEDLFLVGDEVIEGYREPSLPDVWIQNASGEWVNKESIKDLDDLPLRKARRVCVSMTSKTKFETKELKSLKALVNSAVSRIAETHHF